MNGIGPPGNGKGAVQAPIPKHTNLPQSNSDGSIAQARQLELLCIITRALLGIDKKLGLLLQRSDFLSARRVNGHSKNSGIWRH
jgi:hypothetical protein